MQSCSPRSSMSNEDDTIMMSQMITDMKKTMSVLQASPQNEAFYKSNRRQSAIRDMSSLEGVVPMPNLQDLQDRRRPTLAPTTRPTTKKMPSARSLEEASPILHRTRHTFYSKNQRSQSLRCLSSAMMTNEKPRQRRSFDQAVTATPVTPPPPPQSTPISPPRPLDFYGNCLQSLYSSEEATPVQSNCTQEKKHCAVYSHGISLNISSPKVMTTHTSNKSLLSRQSLPNLRLIVCTTA
jgi:hypothetical protein